MFNVFQLSFVRMKLELQYWQWEFVFSWNQLSMLFRPKNKIEGEKEQITKNNVKKIMS